VKIVLDQRFCDHQSIFQLTFNKEQDEDAEGHLQTPRRFSKSPDKTEGASLPTKDANLKPGTLIQRLRNRLNQQKNPESAIERAPTQSRTVLSRFKSVLSLENTTVLDSSDSKDLLYF